MSIGFARKKVDDLDPNYIEVKLTFAGDVNCDGFVDGTDLIALTSGWDPLNIAGNGDKWYKGDLNLDGYVDGTDLITLTSAWNPLGNPIPFPTPALSAVPEPATMSLLCLGALGLLRRRRKNNARSGKNCH
jgi:hypothetical protein